jgi:competence protein ComEA
MDRVPAPSGELSASAYSAAVPPPANVLPTASATVAIGPSPVPVPVITVQVGPVATSPVSPPPSQPAILTAWPRSAQLTTAFLLGLATALLAVHVFSSLRWGSRSADLERWAGTYRIDLNRADRAELLQLPGVGDSLAERIEAYRQEHGSFQSVDELGQVKGIGPMTLERLRPWVCVHSPDKDSEPPPEASAFSPQASPAKGRTLSTKDKSSPRKPGKKEASLTSPIDLNHASVTDLQRLPGIGPKMSKRIIDERAKAPFKTVDDLRRVSGIGPKTLEKLRPYVTVGGPRRTPKGP